MGRNKPKNSRKLKIVYILLASLIPVISLLGYFSYIKFNALQGSNLILKNDYESLLNEYTILKTSEDSSLKEVEHLENILAELAALKKEVFVNASSLEKKIKAKETNAKIAYITFDDGPYYLTYKFLGILDKYHIKATFFTIGSGKTKCYDNSSYECTKLYSEIAYRGHTMGNHTYSHNLRRSSSGYVYSSVNAFITQLDKQAENLLNRTGVTTTIMRFPGGSSTAGRLKSSMISAIRSKGYGYVDWTAQDGDGGYLTSKTQAWNNFKNSINEQIEVLLLHDYSYITLSILPDMIEYLQNNNYVILPLFYDSVMVNK